jgi:hypothetical protein
MLAKDWAIKTGGGVVQKNHDTVGSINGEALCYRRSIDQDVMQQ